jgi:hypothetical protein
MLPTIAAIRRHRSKCVRTLTECASFRGFRRAERPGHPCRASPPVAGLLFVLSPNGATEPTSAGAFREKIPQKLILDESRFCG